MTKEFAGDLWMETQDDGRVRLGFRKQFIDDRCGECFHIMQADIHTVKKGSPLFVLESNDGLTPIKSPLGGKILYFNTKARNFPDRLIEEDVLLEILPEGVKLKPGEETPKAAKVKTKVVADWTVVNPLQQAAQPFIQNWGMDDLGPNRALEAIERERARLAQFRAQLNQVQQPPAPPGAVRRAR